MSEYFFNDTNAWGNNGVPTAMDDFTTPENTTIKIDTNMLHFLGYDNVTVSNNSILKFVNDNLQLIAKTLNLYGAVELNANSTILIDDDGVARQVHSFNDASIWPNNQIPAGGELTFPADIIVEIGSNMLQPTGYTTITIPDTTCVKFVNANIDLYGKQMDIYGEIQLNVNSSITVDTEAGFTVKYFHDPATWPNNQIPGVGEDITVPSLTALVISSQATLAEYYGALTIPSDGMLQFDNTIDNAQLIVTSFTNNGTLHSANYNVVKLLRGNANLYLPVYLNANSQVQDAQAGANSTMDSSSNFIMHCEQTKASTFGKYFKYKVDSNGINFPLENIQNLNYISSKEISIGGFYIPKFDSFTNYFNTIIYRLGAKWQQTGIVINEKSIKDFSISSGVGLPIGGLSKVNIGLEYGKTGTKSNNLMEENYIIISLGLSLSDIWFIKRKYD